ncbi:MAG: outer membrane protein assembly factor BamD, partial [Pseudomonadota bacterium]|nr:outer membrane protein assembly factor BamD [Pseudomonadota bacterium]
ETNEEKVYAQAQRSLRSSNYNSAIEQLELLEARFPFGRFAEQAQLELVYARYMTFDLEGARSGADRFIRLHPGHDNVDYAYYLKGLSAYRDSSNLLDVLFSADQATRDMAPLQEAYADFAIFLGRFPESQYAPDAQQRMVHLRNVLARSELAVADFYMRRGAYIAAGNRARFVLENYPDSEARADALATLVESNWKLNLEDEANRALRVLALNHPDYETFDDAGNFVVAERIRNRDRSWANIMSLGMLDRPEAPAPITIRAPNE